MFRTVNELVAYRGATHPDRPAVRFEGATRSYGDVVARSMRAAGALRDLGVRAGDRVALLELNTADAMEYVLGASLAGAVPVLLNWRLAPPEIDEILEDAAACVLLCGDAFAGVAGNLAARPSLQVVSTRDFAGLAARAAPIQEPAVPKPADTWAQLYTSGTTGTPKGACITHANVTSAIEGVLSELPVAGAASRNLVAAPLFHVAGLVWAMVAVYSGAQNVFLRTFDPKAALDTIEAEEVTHALLVPAMQQAMLGVADLRDRDLSSLRHVLYGGSPMAEATMRAAAAGFDCDLTQAYGLTETSGVLTLLRFDDHSRGLASGAPPAAGRRLRAAGRPLPDVEGRVVRPDGTGADAGEVGEIRARGAPVMEGYWGMPGESFDDGWFCTGDVGHLDADGYLYLVDRLGDRIVTKGENVYPAEVEHVLIEHPGVADVAVIGVPDDEYGETILAAIVPAAGEVPQVGELRRWAAPRIAAYKLPRHVEQVDELPRNPSGKVLRRVLRERHWEGRERHVN